MQRHRRPLDTSALVPVFRGSIGQALVMKHTLEMFGLPAFVQHQFVKSLVPFETGGNVFEFALLAPASAEGEIHELLTELRSRASESAARSAPAQPDAAKRSQSLARAEESGRRLRWLSALYFYAPIPAAIMLVPLAVLMVAVCVSWIMRYRAQVADAGAAPLHTRLTVLTLIATWAFVGATWLLVALAGFCC